MACRLDAKPIYEPVLGYCQLDPRNKAQWHFDKNTKHFILENASKNIIWEKGHFVRGCGGGGGGGSGVVVVVVGVVVVVVVVCVCVCVCVGGGGGGGGGVE